VEEGRERGGGHKNAFRVPLLGDRSSGTWNEFRASLRGGRRRFAFRVPLRRRSEGGGETRFAFLYGDSRVL